MNAVSTARRATADPNRKSCSEGRHFLSAIPGKAGPSAVHGVIAAVAMAAFFVGVVRWASGSTDHLLDQAKRDWYFVVVIMLGFGIQVALVSELRRRRRLHHLAAVAGGTGAGASGIGMVACCAHHIADLLPVVGVTSAAGFLTDYRVPFMVGGIVVDATARTPSSSHSISPRPARST